MTNRGKYQGGGIFKDEYYEIANIKYLKMQEKRKLGDKLILLIQ